MIDQPRTPAGSPDGGQYTGIGGAETATRLPAPYVDTDWEEEAIMRVANFCSHADAHSRKPWDGTTVPAADILAIVGSTAPHWCDRCGEPMRIETGGQTQHTTEAGHVDWDADAHHEAIDTSVYTDAPVPQDRAIVNRLREACLTAGTGIHTNTLMVIIEGND